jgi:hypothetical protein
MTFLATVTTFRKLPIRTGARVELQGGQDLNLQPAVLETAALPIEPPPFAEEIAPLRTPVAELPAKWAYEMMADFNYRSPV